MSKNMDLVIIAIATMQVYDFVNDGETREEAEVRGNSHYIKEFERTKEIYNDYGSEYWAVRVDEEIKIVNAGCKVMIFEDYKKAQREYLLNGELKEITKEDFEEALNVLPPMFWTTHKGVEMFCISEMYTGTYTSQYAHDINTDKYYTKLVDSTDKNTWICELLKNVV